MRRAVWSVIVAGALLARGPAAAAEVEPGATCPVEVRDFEVVTGTLDPGAGCNRFLATAGSNAPTFAYGWYRYRPEVRLPYRVGVTVQRLSADADRSIEVHLVGGIVLLKDGAYAFYATEAGFARAGWRPLPTLRLHRATRIEVVQHRGGIALHIDGRPIDRWSVQPPDERGQVGIAFKGAPDYRARMWFGDVRVEAAAPR